MSLAKQSTLIAFLAAGLANHFVFCEQVCAQVPGSGAAVVRPTDDDFPFAPHPEPIRIGASSNSLIGRPMPSQFVGLTEDTVIWPTKTFAIPLTVETTGSEPVDVQLFVARGPGSQWRMIDQKPATATEFPFEATEDGLYWFGTRTISRKKSPDQGRNSTQPIVPQLKIFIDSTRPNVTVNADADASGQVVARISLDDFTPLRSIQLHYVTDTQREWVSLDIKQMNADGQLSFQPNDSWQQLSLQAVVTDSAGHQQIVSKLLQRPRIAAVPRPSEIASQTAQYRTIPTETASQPTTALTVGTQTRTNDSEGGESNKVESVSNTLVEPFQRIATNPFVTSDSLNGYRGSYALAPTSPSGATTGSIPPSFAPMTVPFQPDQPPALQPELLPSPATPDQVTRGFAGPITSAVPDTSSTPPIGAEVMPPATEANQPPRARSLADAMRPIAEKPTVLNSADASTQPSHDSIESIPAPENAERDPAAEPNDTPYATRKLSSPEFDTPMWDGRVPTRYSDSFRFSLDYELEAVGANGAKAIELWGSTDGGKSWDRWGNDPDMASPFDIETKDEGVFGFRIVVLSHNGLTTPRPLPGETPDIVIVVDKAKPDVRITGATYGEGDRAGSLVIRYACTDPNLMQRPITLAFSDTVDGPWTTIAGGLQNDGDYVWPADPQLPRQIYLRIDATDRAGNVGTYVLDRAIDARGMAPRARIRGFQTLGGPLQPSIDTQTAERPQAAFK